MGGLSLLMIERSEGLETRPIKTSSTACAGTSLVTLHNVKVGHPKAFPSCFQNSFTNGFESASMLTAVCGVCAKADSDEVQRLCVYGVGNAAQRQGGIQNI